MNGYATRKFLHSINGLTMRESEDLKRDERTLTFRRRVLCVAIVLVTGIVLYLGRHL